MLSAQAWIDFFLCNVRRNDLGRLLLDFQMSHHVRQLAKLLQSNGAVDGYF